MLKGIGTDIVEISRIEAVYKRHTQRFVERILTPVEIIESKTRSNICNYLAKQFAAKEAVSKALGVGIGALSFQDIEVIRSGLGQPLVSFSSKAEKKFPECNIHLSLSDSNQYVVAFCVIEKK